MLFMWLIKWSWTISSRTRLFALKMDYIWKSDILRRTLWFMRIHCNWPVKRSCMYTYIHLCLVYLHNWGNWVVLFCFGLLILIIKVVNYIIRTKLKIFIGLGYFEILSWIVVGDYICLCAYMLLVIIYVYVHICCWWLYMFICIYVVDEFSYMLLVWNCWCKHVLEYVGVDLWKSYEICFVVVES